MSYAVTKLYRDTQREFATRGYRAEFKFGWRESAGKALDGQRPEIAFVPGDDKSWKFGDFQGPTFAHGEGSRALAQFGELCTIYVSGIDTAKMEDQAAQYDATRKLFNLFFASLHRSAHGNFAIMDAAWTPILERTGGLTIRLLMRLINPIRDFEDETEIAGDLATINATSTTSDDSVSTGDETPP